MSIWTSLPIEMRAYVDEYPDNEPRLKVDVAVSPLTPLIRIAAWSQPGFLAGFGEFYIGADDALQLHRALAQALRFANVEVEDEP